jgi:hypothetical protein
MADTVHALYGGFVSPDGNYVLFTGNMEEDGDPARAGAPMALMRLSDAPIIGGESPALRALHPEAKDGPVLTLPAGEPCWTGIEIGGLNSSPTADTDSLMGVDATYNVAVPEAAVSEGGRGGRLCFAGINFSGRSMN